MRLRWLIIFVLSFYSVLGWASAKPLPAEQAFHLSARVLDPNTVILHWTMQPGYFLYQKRIHVVNHSPAQLQLGLVRMPKAVNKTDSDGEIFPVYRDQVAIPASILGLKPGKATLQIEYQGCADSGFCYPPTRKVIVLDIAKTLGAQNLVLQDDGIASMPDPHASKFDEILASHNLAWVLLSFFGFGLLLAFTPCVLPMIPVLSGMIAGHGHQITTRKAFLLSLAYVLSMSLTYAAVGVGVALLGSNIQAVMQNPWAITLFAALFVALAFSMFGYYDITLPTSWQVALANISKRQEGGHYLGAMIMGALSTLILSPCVTPPLVGVLTFIANSGNVGLGAIALFSVSLGMGLPLLLIGTSGGKLLPKAGTWMNAVKAFFGVLLLGVAISLLARLLPGALIMVLWALLLIVSGLCIGALKARGQGATYKFWQGAGLIVLVYGVLLVVGAGFGNTDPLQPLENILSRSALMKTPAEHVNVKSLADVEREVANAQQQGKPVFLDFYAGWCVSCKIMDKTTFADPKVKALLAHTVVLRADVTANDPIDKTLQQHFRVVAPPTILFFDTQGQLQPSFTVVGEMTPKDFLKHLQRFLAQQGLANSQTSH